MMSASTMKSPQKDSSSCHLTHFSSWQKLVAAHHDMRDFCLREALSHPARFDEYKLTHDGILFDFSKHLITDDLLTSLYELAKQVDIEGWRARMFAGEHINNSEDRAVLHIACRAPETAKIHVESENVMPFIHQVLKKIKNFSNAVLDGTIKTSNGQDFTDIVNIGIGGSDLGPRFVVDALRNYAARLNIHFVSNVDGEDIEPLLARLDPARTLFIIASKTFTTEETMTNAHIARKWCAEQLGEQAISQHFVALSTNEVEIKKFGIAADRSFAFRDWVGGRYSLWSAIGLIIALAVGYDRFAELLAGAHSMDQHFQTAPIERNIPIRMALLGVWYINFYNYHAHLLMPYDVRLGKFAKFVQQMDMESNGKSIDRDGHHVDYATGPVIFGEAGTDSQHSFMQLVHQSPLPIPADFVICARPHHHLAASHRALMANFLAQTRALAVGQTLEEAGGDPARIFTGNRPTTSIILPALTPAHLGALIAAYEHKVFVQGIIWNLNSFDQPGVELGKKLAKPLKEMLDQHQMNAHLDCSTRGLMAQILAVSDAQKTD